MHSLVWRLLHRVEVVDIADSLYIGQNAGADHQSEQVDSHKHSGAGTEGNEEGRWVRVAVVKLHFYHRHLDEQDQEENRGTTSYTCHYCVM